MPMRFNTVRDLMSAFPSAAEDIGTEPSDEFSADFILKQVAEENWPAAISYCAYLLSRWHAVRWGHETMQRLLRPEGAAAGTMAIVEQWINEPEEANRREVMEHAHAADPREPATWLAFAAAWSGGSIAPRANGFVPPDPELTPRAVRGALLGAIALSARRADSDAAAVLRPALQRGLKMAAGDEGAA